jgi:hypothetical protein
MKARVSYACIVDAGPDEMREKKRTVYWFHWGGHKVYVYRATPDGLSPQDLAHPKNLWTL